MAWLARATYRLRHLWLGGMLLALFGLSACGFAMRTSDQMPFATIGVTPEAGSGVAGDLARYFGDAVRPVAPGRDALPPEVIIDVQQELREKVAVGLNTSGLLREYNLRLTVRFRVRTPQGQELIAPSTIEQHRSISYNESVALAKEAEEAFLYRDMQTEVVQQLVRRLAVLHLPAAPAS